MFLFLQAAAKAAATAGCKSGALTTAGKHQKIR
jgi:hypothetical protein